MKNYKDILSNYLYEYISDCDNLENENQKNDMIEAGKLIQKILNKRFDNEIKNYNGDIEKGTDLFITKRNLNILSIYINELYLLENYTEHRLSIRHHMRCILNNLWMIIK